MVNHTRKTASVFCPNCDATLEPLKCKLVCLRCRTFLDCGDGMLPLASGDYEHDSPKGASVDILPALKGEDS